MRMTKTNGRKPLPSNPTERKDIARPAEWRADINGLRAIAVLLVSFYHAQVPWAEGGFIGVDVFFVISGYLITRAIIIDFFQGGFSFRSFLAKRLRRLVPALIVVMLACFLAGWYFLQPADFGKLSEGMIASIIFTSNIYFSFTDPYLANESWQNPILHTWTLGVEAQFYLSFPSFLIFGLKKGVRFAVVVVVFLMTLSLLISCAWTYLDPIFSFYSTVSRFWEFCVGAVLALWEQKNLQKPEKSLASVGVAVGILTIIVSALNFDSTTLHPGPVTLLPVVGTALVIWFGQVRSWSRSILSLQPMVAIGLASYSLYLWHQPFLVFARLAVSETLTSTLLLILGVTISLASFLTWKFIEEPFRRPAIESTRSRLSGAIITCVLCFLCLWGATNHASRVMFADTLLIYEPIRGINLSDGSPCEINTIESDCLLGKRNVEPRYVLLGDSHAQALITALDHMLLERGEAAQVYIMAGCPFIMEVVRRNYGRDCAPFTDAVFGKLQENRYEVAIILDWRSAYLTGTTAASSLFDENLAVFPVSQRDIELGSRNEALDALQEQTFDRLLNLGMSVVFFFPVPDAPLRVPHEVQRRTRTAKLPYIYPRGSYSSRVAQISKVADEFASHPRFHTVHPDLIFCSKNDCITHDDDEVYYTDSNHLSIEGAKLLIYGALQKILFADDSRSVQDGSQSHEE